MKFSFKIQQYQTDAVDAVARVFQGQLYHAGVSYMRDVGTRKESGRQLSLLLSEEDRDWLELQDPDDDSGFKNEALLLTDEQLLRNIQTIQNESGIHQSTSHSLLRWDAQGKHGKPRSATDRKIQDRLREEAVRKAVGRPCEL